ncbi:translation initiation factor IF-1 [Mycoplasma haemocanis str. Illinois]|uniref:Translation initiation factor IF-1 n=2 Tax=Mycoplasma TaxID=2093 RepID=H6N8E3_MYCHN|nr:translation initiation factor IF-1 [Mycoplasma haemocanis]AEG73744.1 traasnlation initiation factor IF-1 [Mycoplasma haemofelis Ohio2]AEW45915.1 translation initiation factor IF-1 [Mycoplasma haemocanis str. Illinois]
MDNQNKILLGGIVRKIQGGGVVMVELENNTTIACHVSGKMKKYNVHVILGDKVDVEISPYDLTKGRIIKRYIEKPPVSE